MADKQLGLAIRLFQQFEPDTRPGESLWDQVFILAMRDDREDVSFNQKVSEALAFLKSRIH